MSTSENKLDRLRTGLASVRARGAGVSIGRWLMFAGAAMGTIGIALIIMGWTGASHTPYVFEQVPYLISGGILGLALAILGGLCYFGYWISRSIDESRAQSDRTIAELSKIAAALAAATVPNGAARASVASSGKPFVRTAKGTMFHRADCVVVTGRDDLVGVRANGESLEPCRICDPLARVS